MPHVLMVRSLLVGVAVLVAGMALPVAVQPAAPAGAIAVAAAPLGSLDPLECARADDLRVLAALREPLTRLDPASGRVEPALARAWDVDASGTTWTFHLRPDAMWNDGRPVLAEEVRAGLEQHRAGSACGALLADIAAVRPRAGAVVVTTSRPVPDMPARLSLPVFAPRRPEDGAWSDPRHILGNGPFRCTGYHLRHVIDLEPSPTYHGDHPAHSPVRLRMVADPGTALRLYLDQQLDVLPSLTSDLAESVTRAGLPGVQRTTGWGTEFYRVRQGVLQPAQVAALSACLPRPALVHEVLHDFGTPATGLIPHLATHLATATTTTAPWPPLELLIPAGRPDRLRVAEHIVDLWRHHLGVTVRLVTLPPAELAARERTGRYTLSRGSLVGDTPDPVGFLQAFLSDAGMNRTGWADPTYDALVAAAIPPGEDRSARVQAAHHYLLAAGVVIPLYHFDTISVVRPGIRGGTASPWELIHLADLQR